MKIFWNLDEMTLLSIESVKTTSKIYICKMRVLMYYVENRVQIPPCFLEKCLLLKMGP